MVEGDGYNRRRDVTFDNLANQEREKDEKHLLRKIQTWKEDSKTYGSTYRVHKRIFKLCCLFENILIMVLTTVCVVSIILWFDSLTTEYLRCENEHELY